MSVLPEVESVTSHILLDVAVRLVHHIQNSCRTTSFYLL